MRTDGCSRIKNFYQRHLESNPIPIKYLRPHVEHVSTVMSGVGVGWVEHNVCDK